jgi:hypothetical protein
VILLRLPRRRRGVVPGGLILVDLPQVADDLEAGGLVVIEEGRVAQASAALILQ